MTLTKLESLFYSTLTRKQLSSDLDGESSDDNSLNSRARNGDDRAESAHESDIEMSATKKICRESVGIGELLCVSPKIKWEIYKDIDPFESTWLQKFTPRPGILVDTSEFAPVDYFYLLFPNEAFKLISTETNRYAIQYLDSTTDFEPSSRFHAWSDMSPDKIKAFVSLEIAMGLCQKPAHADYWSGFWLSCAVFIRYDTEQV